RRYFQSPGGAPQGPLPEPLASSVLHAPSEPSDRTDAAMIESAKRARKSKASVPRIAGSFLETKSGGLNAGQKSRAEEQGSAERRTGAALTWLHAAGNFQAFRCLGPFALSSL